MENKMENEWELSKENVQPLRQGRQMSCLTAGLQPQMQTIKDERHVFEAELRTYTGDDPLDVWYKYIRWIEQTFPKGGADSSLPTIVERCLRQFHDNQTYKNDERYVYIWMKMADSCTQPLDIYSFMYDQNIGCELSIFYVGWAILYEQLGNTKKADAIYAKGMSKNAHPIETLKCRQEEFHKRIARMTVEGHEFMNQEDPSVPESWGQPDAQGQGQRQVLSQLRATGKKHAAPINRTGNAIAGGAGQLAGARPKTSQQNPKNIQIFQDENQGGSMLPPQTNEWKGLPKRDVTNKENEKKAGVWTKQKLGKTGSNMPISAVNSYRQPSYTVHVDEDADSSMRTPMKKPEMSQQVLSARKEKPTSTIDYLRSMTSNQNKNEMPMYCKEKIYCGIEEFTFEELRAFKWKKDQEQKKRADDNKDLENQRQKLESERQLLFEQTERLRIERLKMKQAEEALIEETRRKLKEQQIRSEHEIKTALEKQQEVIERSIEQRMREQMSTSNSFSSQTRQDSFNSSNRTPNNLSRASINPSSGERSGAEQSMFGSASPTVNTKEALMVVRGMFNTSLERNGAAIEEETDMVQPNIKPRSPAGQGSGNGFPFQIFDENQSSSQNKNSKPSAMPFAIFDENQGRQKKQNVPKTAVPFTIFEESKESSQAKKPSAVPFTVFQDSENDTRSPSKQSNTPMLTSPIHKSSNRSGFQLQQSHVLFEEENTESIESYARDDITQAPIGSHLSFAEAAKYASTPSNKMRMGGEQPKADSSFEMMEDGSNAAAAENAENDTHPSLTSRNDYHTGLSPIVEGSTEDSGSSSKSGHHTTFSQHIPNLSVIDSTPCDTEPPEDTMSLIQLKPLDEANNSNTHLIDISSYIPPDMDEKTENFLSMSICLYDQKDPFDEKMKNEIVSKLKQPLSSYEGYIELNDCLPEFKKGSDIFFDMECYTIIQKIGEGGFAKVYLAEIDDNDITFNITKMPQSQQAIKVQEPGQRWEFFICKEVHRRLAALNDPVDVRPAMMEIHKGLFFKNGSCLFTSYHKLGTLLDVTNLYSKIPSEAMNQVMEPVVTFMMIELLHMIENLHKCNIIHGDIKPDNFLFLKFPKLPASRNSAEIFAGGNRFAQLIDFGQSIDMTKYKSGTTFMTKVTTKCFQCTEMKTNRPWTYQTDYFGLAGTIHVMIFKQYMKVYQIGNEWKMTSSFNRNWNTDLWKKLFHILLNVPSCDELPDLSAIRKEFEEYFVDNLLDTYNSKCEAFNNWVGLVNKVDKK